jgi:hypothetical protein
VKELAIIARVSSVYHEQKTARVYREDTDTISSELIILERGDSWTPQIGDYVACLFFSYGGSGIILGKA